MNAHTSDAIPIGRQAGANFYASTLDPSPYDGHPTPAFIRRILLSHADGTANGPDSWCRLYSEAFLQGYGRASKTAKGTVQGS